MCKHPRIRSEDQGIGHYEYWGFTGYDSKIVPVCAICDQELDPKYIDDEGDYIGPGSEYDDEGDEDA
jgi:hypothetical protein